MKNWPESTSKYKNFSAISIMCKKMQEHPVELECPKLELLQLDFGKYSERFPNGIFEGMKELKVVSLKVLSLLKSLTMQKKLRAFLVTETSDMIRWRSNPAPEIGHLIGDNLMNLEFLSFSTTRPCKEFPVEIGGLLCNLRFLRFTRVRFQYVPPGVLSKLGKLEELYLPWEFMEWGRREATGLRINASLDEIESLPLTALEIGMGKGSVLAENFVKNLTRFQVCLGNSYNVAVHSEIKRPQGDNAKTLFKMMTVDACDVTASQTSSAFLRKSESLTCISVENLKNITYLQLGNNGFEQLKKISIRHCREMEYLVDQPTIRTSSSFSQLKSLDLFQLINLKETICHNNFSKREAPILLFRNLIRISIACCPNLKSVFPLSVARGLSQFQWINIRQCHDMEKAFYTDEVDDHHNQLQMDHENSSKGDEKHIDAIIMDPIIIFPQLKVLELEKMCKLRVFYDGNHAIKLPSLELS